MNNLNGKSIVITGATSGIGFATATQLVGLGAFVIGIGRSQDRCNEAESNIRSIHTTAEVQFLLADLSLQSEVLQLSTKIKWLIEENGQNKLDCLINNAAAFYFWLSITPEGFEKQWAINYLSHFLLTHELMPLLKHSPQPRIINLSSNSHYKADINWDDIQLKHRYNGMRAYQQTKLAMVLFSAEFNRRTNTNIRAFAADPGLVDTGIASKSDFAPARWFWNWNRKRGIQPEEAAMGLVYLISEGSIQDSRETYWKHGISKTPSTIALNPEAASRLWSISEKMCHIEPGRLV
jgi:NAD(P)-dependent dehydrogenase (short-subunit alcohol dehydrogenase family)